MTLQRPGESPKEAQANPTVPVEAGGSEYFSTFRIPLIRGRGFTSADRAGTPLVAVVSQALARQYWPGGDPIGARFRMSGDTGGWRTVVGVAGDIRFRSLREPTPTLYLPWRQSFAQTFFAIRTRGDPAPVVAAVRREVRAFDSAFQVWRAGTMDEYLAGPLAQPRLSALLLSGFALAALLLAAIGLFGVMASAVRERTRDLGIRMALGARPEQLRGEVLRDALRLSGLGLAAGLVAALLATRALRALLFEVSPWDPLTLLGVCLILLAVAALAAYLPARRATRVDPVDALRAE